MAETELQRIEDDARQILANLATDVTTLAADVAAVKGNVLTAIQAANAPLWLPSLLARLDALKAAVDDLKTQATTNQAAVIAELDKIEQDLAPPSPISLQYRSTTAMGIVTIIALTAGSTSDQVNVEDENGVLLAASTITWSAPLGEKASTDLVMAPSMDGMGTTFSASAAAPTEAVTLNAIWTDPTGVASPLAGPTLTVNITGVGAVAPTALQYNEVSGS